jgi:hypothetical protein
MSHTVDRFSTLNLLKGGDRRALGGAEEALQLVLSTPALLDDLFAGMLSDDPLMRMRCADVAEKASRLQPQWLVPYKTLLLDILADQPQQEVRWHVAPMLARLPLSSAEQKRVLAILVGFLSDHSSIVKTMAMQAMADLAIGHEAWRPEVRSRIEALMDTGTPAMKARGRKLLRKLWA